MQRRKYYTIQSLIYCLAIVLWANGFVGPVLSAYASDGQTMFICTPYGLQPVGDDGSLPVVKHCKNCLVQDEYDGSDDIAFEAVSLLVPGVGASFYVRELQSFAADSPYSLFFSRGPPV